MADDLGRALREDGIASQGDCDRGEPGGRASHGVDPADGRAGGRHGATFGGESQGFRRSRHGVSRLVVILDRSCRRLREAMGRGGGLRVDLAIAGRAAGGGHDLAEYVAHLATEMGGETEHRLQDLAIETHAAFLRCVAARGPTTAPQRSWMRRRRRDTGPARRGSATI